MKLIRALLYAPVVLGLGLVAMAGQASSYLLQPGDLIEVHVWREPELTRQVIIRPDGQLSFPLVGDMPAAGRSVTDVTESLKKAIHEYIPEAVVTISLQEPKGNKVFIIGKVNRPGEYVMAHTANVLQALSMAGGFSPYAKRSSIKVIRSAGAGFSAFDVDYDHLSKGQNLDTNLIVLPGDVIIVP